MTASITSAAYDGTAPFPAASAPVRTRAQRTGQVTVTGLIVVGPFAGLAGRLRGLLHAHVGWMFGNDPTPHHADPACARHGVDRGQIDLSAELIPGFERPGLVSGVRWPAPARLERRRPPRAITAAHVLAGGRVPAPIEERPASLLAPMSRRSLNAG